MRLTYFPLAHVKSLAIDTAPFIYFIEKHPTYIDRMRLVMQHIVTPSQTTAYASVMTLAEVLVQPLKTGNIVLAQHYERILVQTKRLNLINITPAIARQTAKLRSDYGIKTPDALHIATAIVSGCDGFLTNDRTLKRIHEINVIILDNLTSAPQDFRNRLNIRHQGGFAVYSRRARKRRPYEIPGNVYSKSRHQMSCRGETCPPDEFSNGLLEYTAKYPVKDIPS